MSRIASRLALFVAVAAFQVSVAVAPALLVSVLGTPAESQDSAPFTIPGATVQEWQGRPLTWRSHDGATRSATATLYRNAGHHDADEWPYTVVVVQGDDNPVPVPADAERLAKIVGRGLGVSPARLAFLYRLTAEGADRPRTVRATFRPSSSDDLGSPSWRVLSLEEVEDYTAGR